MRTIFVAVILASLSLFAHAADGRLSVASGDPAPEGDIITSKIYLTNTNELILSLTSTAHLAGRNYDVFEINQGSVICSGPAWASNTLRALAVHQVGADIVNANAMTCINGDIIYTVEAGHGVLLGGFRAFDNGLTRMTKQSRLVWDASKPILWPVSRIETASTWSYGSTLFRQANNNSQNQIEVFNGMSCRPVDITASGYMIGSGGLTSGFIGVGLDSSIADSSQIKNPCAGAASFPVLPCWARFVGYAGIGYHELRLIERGNGSAITWVGTNGYAGYGYGTGLIGFVLQ